MHILSSKLKGQCPEMSHRLKDNSLIQRFTIILSIRIQRILNSELNIGVLSRFECNTVSAKKYMPKIREPVS